MMNSSRRRGPLSTRPEIKSKLADMLLALVSNYQTLPLVLLAALLAWAMYLLAVT